MTPEPAEACLFASDAVGWRWEARCLRRQPQQWRIVAPDGWATPWSAYDHAAGLACAEIRRRMKGLA